MTYRIPVLKIVERALLMDKIVVLCSRTKDHFIIKIILTKKKFDKYFKIAINAKLYQQKKNVCLILFKKLIFGFKKKIKKLRNK